MLFNIGFLIILLETSLPEIILWHIFSLSVLKCVGYPSQKRGLDRVSSVVHVLEGVTLVIIHTRDQYAGSVTGFLVLVPQQMWQSSLCEFKDMLEKVICTLHCLDA